VDWESSRLEGPCPGLFPPKKKRLSPGEEKTESGSYKGDQRLWTPGVLREIMEKEEKSPGIGVSSGGMTLAGPRETSTKWRPKHNKKHRKSSVSSQTTGKIKKRKSLVTKKRFHTEGSYNLTRTGNEDWAESWRQIPAGNHLRETGWGRTSGGPEGCTGRHSQKEGSDYGTGGRTEGGNPPSGTKKKRQDAKVTSRGQGSGIEYT